jgi:hypothetical protein
VLAAPALGQPSAINRAKVPAGTETVHVLPSTKLADVLAKPDTTKVVLADGKQTTVGEIRRSVGQREQHIASLKTHVQNLPGKLAVRSTDAAARLKSLAATLSAEDAAAKAAHGAPATLRGPGVIGALNMKNFEGILRVNRRERGWHVTPGGFLTIDGQGFGDTIGEVKVFGQFENGPLALNPIDWRKEQIYAQLPVGIRGVIDQDVQVQVVTAARKKHRFEGGRFIATRGEEFVVTSGIHRLIRHSSGGWNAAMGDDGRVHRWTAGTNIDCPRPGFDNLTTLDPGRGFTVTGLGAHFGRTDSGEGDEDGMAGNRTFFPGYDFGPWAGDDLHILWGVWRSHTSPRFGGILDGVDVCRSDYQIEVSVQGPLGVPF